jgi:hypothetical protein
MASDTKNKKQHANESRALDEHSPRETDHPFELPKLVQTSPTMTEQLRRKASQQRDIRTWKMEKLDGQKVNPQSEEIA